MARWVKIVACPQNFSLAAKMTPPPQPPTPDTVALPGLATFLAERRGHITGLWIEAVRRHTRLGTSDGMTDEDLADHLPMLFEDLEALLRGEEVAEKLARHAEAHGEHRWQQRYELEEVLKELGLVCRVLLKESLDVFEHEHPDAPREQLQEARERILTFFEDAAAGSVRRYADKQREQLDTAHGQTRESDRSLAAAVQSDRDRLAEVFQRSPSFIALLKGPEHVFALANEQYQQLVGNRDVLGQPVRQALPEVAGQGFFTRLDQVYTTGEPYVGNDVRIMLQSQSGAPLQEHFLDFVYLPTRSPAGVIDGIFVHGVDWTERKTAQRTMTELSEQRRLALDSAQMGWWQLDLGSKVVSCDERFRAIFGTDQAVVTYDWALSVIHPDDRMNVDASVQAAVRPVDPAPYTVECRLMREDGTTRWVTAKGQAIFEGEGPDRRAVNLVGTVADVTEAKALQDALRESEVRLREVTNAMPQIVWSALPDGHVDHWNQRWYDYTGTQPGTFGDASWQDIVHPESATLIASEWSRSVATGEPYEQEIRLKGAAEGNYRWFLSRATPVRDAGGKIVRWIGTSTDIHEQKTAKAALAFERHQLELIFQDSPAAMATWRGEDLVFARVNPEYQDFFRGRQLLGRPLLEACPELAGQGFDDLLRRVMHTGEPFVGCEVLARIQRDKDGPVQDRYYDFSYLQVCDPDGRPWGVYDHAVDVTDRVMARLALEQTQRDLQQALADRQQLLEAEQTARTEAERISRVKDEFLATLSHELRTPLNAILGWAQVLRGDPGNVEDVKDGLATIERNAKAQTQIIEDLLDMSKIISGKVRLNVERLDLAAVVEGAVETARPAATAKHISLRTTIDPQLSTVSGDSSRLQQVFWNLLSNAIKFTPKGGSVQVGLDRIESHLEVRVMDSGEGIAPEFLPDVFDKFRQQDASTTRQHGGLGLGLAIVKQLVELHGGSVRVESAGKGQGATFVVTLLLSVLQPAAEPDEAGHRGRQPADSPALSIPTESLRLEGIKVLVVDDEPDARALVKRLLEDRQAQVTAAGSVAEALECFQAERPDVMVSDIGMPGEDGYSLIRRVRALGPEHGGNTPAIALTAYARAEDRLKALMAGFQVHASKPVDATELLVLVATLVGRAGNF